MSYDKDYQPVWNEISELSDYKAHNRTVQFEWSPKSCWWVIPTIEINTAMKEVSIYLFCLSIYITWDKNRRR